MVDPIQMLKAEKAKILADAQRKADALDADARDLERLAELALKYGYSLVETPHHGQSPPPEHPPPEKNGAVYKAAIKVSENAIRAAGVPLELSVLFDACVDQGVQLAGKRPQSTLSAYLAHGASTVHSIRRGVYWLKGVNPPQE